MEIRIENLSHIADYAHQRSRVVPSGWKENVFTLAMPVPGQRVDLEDELNDIILRYGAPGVLLGRDHRGQGFLEVRTLDFSTLWPTGPRQPMNEKDRKTLWRLTHSPDRILIHAAGFQAHKPVTGRWVFEGDRDYDRLRGMRRLGWWNEPTTAP